LTALPFRVMLLQRGNRRDTVLAERFTTRIPSSPFPDRCGSLGVDLLCLHLCYIWFILCFYIRFSDSLLVLMFLLSASVDLWIWLTFYRTEVDLLSKSIALDDLNFLQSLALGNGRWLLFVDLGGVALNVATDPCIDWLIRFVSY
jgi:hypothetical protein